MLAAEGETAMNATTIASPRINSLLRWLAPDRADHAVSLESTTAIADVPPKHVAVADNDRRPTIARSNLAPTGLFQGWGPRLA